MFFDNKYLEKYIKIHEISKKIKYDVEIDISSDAYELMIPHLILQPIVENAVFHGLGQNTQNPEISFFVSYKENTLVIEINDNGIGIEPEKLSLMNNKEALGYGLSNVVFRLDFYYGENYSLEFFSKDMKGTSVVMTIKNTDGLKLQN